MKTIKPLFWILLAPLLLLAAGCPSEGGESMCSAAAPCGGNIVGTWKVTESCLTLTGNGSREFCPQLPLTLEATVAGTVTYNPDMTYTQTGTGNFTIELHFPASCMTGGTRPATCAEVQAREMAAVQYRTLTCRAEAGGCVCNGASPDISVDQTGTWQTAGNVLTTMFEGESETSEYCVTGNELHQRFSNYVVGEASGSGAVVQVKQ